MFELLKNTFRNATSQLTGVAVLTESLLEEPLREVQKSLLEADVEYGVVRGFLANVKTKCLDSKVRLTAGKGNQKQKITAGDLFIQACYEELVALLGGETLSFQLPKDRLGLIMMVGLQGAGKTTTSGKLALHLRSEEKRKPLLVAADLARPAAVEQLKVLGQKIGVPVFHKPGLSPVEMCREGVEEAKAQGCDLVIFDTAGRLAVDTRLMEELQAIRQITVPDHILFVCDAMMGQDALATAQTFDQALNLSGFVMTKMEGDARGGAALSIRTVTGKPIQFLGTGEGMNQLERFRPDGLAGRILGKGDVLGLMEDFKRVAEEEEEPSEEKKARLLRGDINFEDLLGMIRMLSKMGPLQGLLGKIPLPGGLNEAALAQDGEKLSASLKVIIQSMTPKERRHPAIISDSRIKRIARGSGRSPTDVRQMLNSLQSMKSMAASMLGRVMPTGQTEKPRAGPTGQDLLQKVSRDAMKKARKKLQRKH